MKESATPPVVIRAHIDQRRTRAKGPGLPWVDFLGRLGRDVNCCVAAWSWARAMPPPPGIAVMIVSRSDRHLYDV